MSAKPPAIDCAICHHWAVHCPNDLQPAFVNGRWHHPSHADDLIRARRVEGVAVRLPSGELLSLGVVAGWGETE